MTKMLFDLQNVDAQVVADEITPLLHRPQGSVVVMPQARQILVMDTGATLRAIHGVIRRIKSTPAGRNLGNQVIQLAPNLTPFGDAHAPLLEDVSGLDPTSLQMLEDYYTQLAQARDVRREAKLIEINAFNETGKDRDRLLDRARQLSAEGDVVELQAEAALNTTRAKLLRERKEELQKRRSNGAAAGTISAGDRLIVRIGRSADPSEHQAQVVKVEADGTLILGGYLRPVRVTGKTLQEAEEEIRKAGKHEWFGDVVAVQITLAPEAPNQSH
jgi:hypothetical protein